MLCQESDTADVVIQRLGKDEEIEAFVFDKRSETLTIAVGNGRPAAHLEHPVKGIAAVGIRAVTCNYRTIRASKGLIVGTGAGIYEFDLVQPRVVDVEVRTNRTTPFRRVSRPNLIGVLASHERAAFDTGSSTPRGAVRQRSGVLNRSIWKKENSDVLSDESAHFVVVRIGRGSGCGRFSQGSPRG